MPLCFKLILAGPGVIVVGLGVAMWYGSARWSRTTSSQVQKLTEVAAQQQPALVGFQDFDELPAPVAKYLRFALREGQPTVRSVRLRRVGELRGIGEQEWSPYQATQFIGAGRPGFVWDANIRMGLMRIRVRDSYVVGKAAGRVSSSQLSPWLISRTRQS